MGQLGGGPCAKRTSLSQFEGAVAPASVLVVQLLIRADQERAAPTPEDDSWSAAHAGRKAVRPRRSPPLAFPVQSPSVPAIALLSSPPGMAPAGARHLEEIVIRILDANLELEYGSPAIGKTLRGGSKRAVPFRSEARR